MRSHPILIALSVLLLTFCIAVSVLVVQHRRIVYPNPETESAFLKNYAPGSAVEPFDSHQLSSMWSHHQSDAAGDGFATHSGGFQGKFAIRSEQWASLMTALSDDVSTQLSRDGAQILAKTGDPRAGFHFDYKLGRSYGVLTISPLEISTSPRLPEGTVAVVLDIALIEKWFPKEPGMITVRASYKPEPSH
jgi:hypothetical protein